MALSELSWCCQPRLSPLPPSSWQHLEPWAARVGQSQQQWWKAPTNKSLAGIHKTRHSLSSNSPSKRDCYGSYVSGRVYPDYAALHF